MCFGLGNKLKRGYQSAERKIDSAINNVESLLLEIENNRKGIPALVDEKILEEDLKRKLSNEKKWEIKAKTYLDLYNHLWEDFGEAREKLGELKTAKEIAELHNY
jgi:hypothetical protein